MDLFISTLGDIMASYNGAVEDVAVLPADKLLFKQAILVKLSTVSDEKMREALIQGYVGLASFQLLTSSEKEVVETYNSLMAKGLPAASESEKIRLAAVQLATIGPAYHALLERTLSESELLIGELHAAGVMKHA